MDKYPIWKRFLDVSGASLGLLLIMPVVPVIMVAICSESRGLPVVRLVRVSEGREVKVYKFRSMERGAHLKKQGLLEFNERGDGPFFKMQRDPRVTHVGKVLRKTRVDEFPQLINVLKGELALVGPRPHEPGEVEHYPGVYKHILNARSGVTGASQVNGASSLKFLEELEYDREYVENMSLREDVRIVGKTLRILFFDQTAV